MIAANPAPPTAHMKSACAKVIAKLNTTIDTVAAFCVSLVLAGLVLAGPSSKIMSVFSGASGMNVAATTTPGGCAMPIFQSAIR